MEFDLVEAAGIEPAAQGRLRIWDRRLAVPGRAGWRWIAAMTEYRVETVEMGSGFKSKDPREVTRGFSRRRPKRDGDSYRPAWRGAVSWRVGPCTCSSSAAMPHQTPKVVFEALPSCTTRRRHRRDRLRQSAADRAPSEESHRRQAPRAAQLLASAMALI